MLNLTQAFELYDLLAPYLPQKIEPGELTISYVEKILDNMRKGKDQDILTRVMMLLTGLSRQELAEFPSKDVLSSFIDKLSENKILDLVDFMREIGYGRRA